MTEQSINLERLEDAISVFGSFDENIRLIEHELGVSVVSRDSQLKVSGEDPEQVMYAIKAIENLMTLAARGEPIQEQNVRYVLQLVREGQEVEISERSPSTGRYTYLVEPSVAMSGIYRTSERIKARKGKIAKIEHTQKGFYLVVEVEE